MVEHEHAPKPMSPEELNSRRALIFLDTLNLFGKTPGEFLKRNIMPWQNLRISDQEGKKGVLKRLSRDLYDLSFRFNQPEVSQRIVQTYGEKKSVLYEMLDSVKPQINKIKEKRMNPLEPYGIVQRIKIAKELTDKILLKRSLDQDQKEQFLNLIGYSEKETKNVLKALGGSAVAFASLLPIYLIGQSVAGAYELKNPYFNEVNNHAKTILLLSILYNQTVAYLSAYTDKRLLEKTGITPNILAAGMFYVLKKLLPDHKKLITPTILTSALPETIKDIGGIGTLISNNALSVFVGIDLVNASLRLVEIIVKEGIIMSKNHKTKNKV